MVKSILIDEGANQALNNILLEKSPSKSSKTGLLIGTIDTTKDYIIHVLSTPLNDESIKKDTKERENELSWIVDHALQIHEMLVGGQDILGMYFVDSPVANCRQILTKVFKELNKFDYYKHMKFNSERLMFLVNLSEKSINMKAMEVLGAESSKPQLLTCEISSQLNLLSSQFFKINSNFKLNSAFKTPNVKSHNKEDFYSALSTSEMFDDNKFVCLINDCFIDANSSFIDIKSKIDKQILENSNNTEIQSYKYEYNASLMENLSIKSKLEEETSKNLDSIYELTGVCNLVVIFHKSMKIEHLKNLLVYDLIRSLHSRIRLLVEDLDARKDIIGDGFTEDPNSNDVSAIEESYQTPNRIHIYLNPRNDLNSFSFLISDYVFPDENDLDISERIKELFSCELVDSSKQIIFVEDLPPEIKRSQSEDLKKLSDIESSRESLSVCSKNASPGFFDNGVFYICSLLVGIFVILIGFYSYKAAFLLNDDGDL